MTGLKARGGSEVPMSWTDGKLQKAEILSRFGKQCRVRIAGATEVRTIATAPGETYSLSDLSSAGSI